MEFWLAATNFSQSVEEGRGECQADAMVLYDKFFSMQATSPLGFPSSVRLQVEDSICSAGGPDYTCFHLPLQLVLKYLEERFLQPFLQSTLYSNYVKELISTIQASPRSLSGLVANIYSASASGRSYCRNKVGRVNSFGRYEPGLDLAPRMSHTEGTKKTSRFGRVVKNLVTNEEKEKMKEELAWQVAEAIVRDVTSITQPEKEQKRKSSIGQEDRRRNSYMGQEDRARGDRDPKRQHGIHSMSKSRSETLSLRDLSLELPTAKYF